MMWVRFVVNGVCNCNNCGKVLGYNVVVVRFWCMDFNIVFLLIIRCLKLVWCRLVIFILIVFDDCCVCCVVLVFMLDGFFNRLLNSFDWVCIGF